MSLRNTILRRIEEERKLSDTPLTRQHYHHRGRREGLEEALQILSPALTALERENDKNRVWGYDG